MANITANINAAFIFYGGEWDDSSDDTRTTSAVGSTVSLEFNGTSFSAFGTFNPSNDNFTYLVDDQPPGINMTTQLSQAPDQPFLVLRNLTKGHHSIMLNLTNGTLGLSRLVCDTEGSLIDPSNDPAAIHTEGGEWVSLNRSGMNFRVTNTDLANITFLFQGTGIMLTGLTGPEGGSFKQVDNYFSAQTLTSSPFSATLDSLAPVVRNASSKHEHIAVLHRNDGLPNKNHTLTLTKTGGAALRVGQAHIFVPPGSTSTASTASSPSSTTTSSTNTPTPLPSSGGMSKGAVAGTVIGVLVGVGLLAAMLWLRRRLPALNAFEKNQVAYARLCSKCRQDITGDYRLECVEPDCPARIDLHPECQDWNVPENHDHEVRQVPNK